MDILSKIVVAKQKRLKARQQKLPLAELQRKSRLINADGAKRFEVAIRRTDCRMRIIAELKRASPSAGLIREKFEVLKLAQEYKGGGQTPYQF